MIRFVSIVSGDHRQRWRVSFTRRRITVCLKLVTRPEDNALLGGVRCETSDITQPGGYAVGAEQGRARFDVDVNVLKFIADQEGTDAARI